MLSKRLLIAAILLVVVFDLALVVVMFAPKLLGLGRRPPGQGTTAVVQQIQTVSELVTVKYIIEKVVILEDVRWIAGLGENRLLLLAHGIVKGGIDLGKLKPDDIEIVGKTVRVRLPPARITEAYLDERQTRVIERTTGLLRTFDKDLEQNARIEALEDIKRAARNSGILKEAEARAKIQLTQLFKQMGFERVEFQSR